MHSVAYDHYACYIDNMYVSCTFSASQLCCILYRTSEKNWEMKLMLMSMYALFLMHALFQGLPGFRFSFIITHRSGRVDKTFQWVFSSHVQTCFEVRLFFHDVFKWGDGVSILAHPDKHGANILQNLQSEREGRSIVSGKERRRGEGGRKRWNGGLSGKVGAEREGGTRGEMREEGGERRGGRKGRERREGRFGRAERREETGETHRTPLCESCIWSRAIRYILIAWGYFLCST